MGTPKRFGDLWPQGDVKQKVSSCLSKTVMHPNETWLIVVWPYPDDAQIIWCHWTSRGELKPQWVWSYPSRSIIFLCETCWKCWRPCIWRRPMLLLWLLWSIVLAHASCYIATMCTINLPNDRRIHIAALIYSRMHCWPQVYSSPYKATSMYFHCDNQWNYWDCHHVAT